MSNLQFLKTKSLIGKFINIKLIIMYFFCLQVLLKYHFKSFGNGTGNICIRIIFSL